MLINNNVLCCYSGGASCRAGVVQFKSIKYRIIRIITDYENHSSPTKNSLFICQKSIFAQGVLEKKESDTYC